MTLKDAQARHAKLAAEIRQHDHAYYVIGKAEITDYEYDALFKQLQDLEREFPSSSRRNPPRNASVARPLRL